MTVQKKIMTDLRLRKLLWQFHGCSCLYGDDGEMQCAKCGLDFKRDSIDVIDTKLNNSVLKKVGLENILTNEKFLFD